MASRRAPLANVPNAVNSPFRNGLSTKRTRGLDDPFDGQPATKKQQVDRGEYDEENVDPKRRGAVPITLHEKLLSARKSTQPAVTEAKSTLWKESRPGSQSLSQQHHQQQQQRTQHARNESKGAADENLQSILQWQRHYRQQFPQFVFYFDSVPTDTARVRSIRAIQQLGAREEKFFSKNVTHVITTRQIPPEDSRATNAEENASNGAYQPKTVQPSDLTQPQRRTASMLDATLQRRTQSSMPNPFVQQAIDPRKIHSNNADILVRARGLGIKIWAMEKLQRVLGTILTAHIGEAGPEDIRGTAHESRATVKVKDNGRDLEQLLRNEKIHGPADRDMTVAAQDMNTFKGYYIYIHDMDEKTKPVMVRDFPKPGNKEDGKWPQFRISAQGRCPFIEDPHHVKKLQQQEHRERASAKAQEELQDQRRTRSTFNVDQSRVLTEHDGNAQQTQVKASTDGKDDLARPLDPPKVIPATRQSSGENAFTGVSQMKRVSRMFGREPMASGMQRSNVTSAIRSQVISSAAISSTAPGISRRVADSKEVSALKRKVLERGGVSVTSNYSMPSSYVNDVRAAINENQDPPPRAAKRRALETLGVVHEDEPVQETARPSKVVASKPKPKPVAAQKEAKPGYCENCRDKFDDFDTHIHTKKHRKFALELDNWSELDYLLNQLRRPHVKYQH